MFHTRTLRNAEFESFFFQLQVVSSFVFAKGTAKVMNLRRLVYISFFNRIDGKLVQFRLKQLRFNCALSYGIECWAMKVEDLRRMKSTEMIMLRMICDKTVRDKVRNEQIRERTEVESIEEHLREQRLRWFGRMEKIDCERPQSVAMYFKIDCSEKGRPKRGERR